MPRPCSLDLRQRLFRARDAGLSAADRPPGRARTIPEADEPDLRAQVAAHPDDTLAMHCARWAAAGKATVSTATMCRALARLKLPLKKRR